MRHATYHFGYTESSGNPVGGSPAPSLAGLLLLLFVPLRYEVAFRHTEEDTFVRGKVSWLLHLVTARIFYEKPGWKRAVGENRRLSADSEEGEEAEAREKDIA